MKVAAFFFEVSFFFESQNETEKEKKPSRERHRKIKYRGARPLLLRRGLPSSTFLAHLYDALKGIKNTHHHHLKMGIKGLPEQLKHYYRDAQVEQFKGMNAQSHF